MQVLQELGARIRLARINTPLTQAELAERAGVSLRTVSNLERGRDVNVSSLLDLLRALGMLDNAEMLVPPAQPRPTDIAKLGKERQRATSRAARKAATGTWKWGDEA